MEKQTESPIRPREAQRLSGVTLETLEGFDQRALQDMRRIPVPNEREQINELLSLSEEKKVFASAIFNDGSRIGTFVWSIAPVHGKKTLWIVAITADAPEGTPLLFPMLGDTIRKLARKHNCEWVRADTSRPPVFKLLIDLGFLPGNIELYSKV